MTRRRVAVLFGGRSAEHEVSCISARYVIDALDPERTEVVPIGITRDGRWHRLSGPPALPVESGRMPEVTDGSGTVVELAAEAGSRELVAADGSHEPIDVVFPVLHGPLGEDGAVQGLLELAGVPYVGAGVLGSAIGMDKDVQKRLFLQAGLPVGPFETVHEKEWADDPEPVEASAEALGYPLFTKPATLGSSVGVSKVHDTGGAGGGPRRSVPLRTVCPRRERRRGRAGDRMRGPRQRRAGGLASQGRSCPTAMTSTTTTPSTSTSTAPSS